MKITHNVHFWTINSDLPVAQTMIQHNVFKTDTQIIKTLQKAQHEYNFVITYYYVLTNNQLKSDN